MRAGPWRDSREAQVNGTSIRLVLQATQKAVE